MTQELKDLLIRLFVSEEPFFGSNDKCTIDREDIEALRAWYRRELREAESLERSINAALDELDRRDKGAA